MIHITVKQKGQEPRPRRCHADAALFTCPFCTTDACKPRQYHQIMTHIAGHKLRAVEYGDHVIYSCNIGCGKKGKHFHCCKCPKTYINKGAMKKHLCSAHPIATCTPEPQPVGHPLQEPPSQRQPASHPPLEPPSQQRLASHSSPEPTSQQQPASHSLQEPPSQQQAASQPSPKPPSQQQAGSQPKELESQQAAPPAIGKMQSSVQCPSRHITIKLKGQEPRPRRCRTDATLFTCPFCTTDKQPVSHSKELDLQQAAPHPQELTASPAIEKKHVSVQCPHRHITVKQKGQEPRPRRCHADATLFTCPFCTTEVCKPRQYHQIMTHIAGHKLRAVEYWR
ncbi:protein piccolo isoform X4 [Labeo rohita]|uniref:protein piccolo isoform X4 n=1 Tax=Labeo rohita TaxID=84645 RepID=UPI0021E24799|nr:protein piccolo isoform X4 [Labeo rohita]